jgi:hypothetical protein
MSVYPTNFHTESFDRLPMPLQIHPIPTNPKVLGAYWTLNLNTLIPLFVLLFSLIFKASKAYVARSYRGGQAKDPTGR